MGKIGDRATFIIPKSQGSGVLNWEDIVKIADPGDRAKAEVIAAKAVWAYCRRMIRQGTWDAQAAYLTMHRNQPALSAIDVEGAIAGWEWHGVMQTVYFHLWDSLRTHVGRDAVPDDNDQGQAFYRRLGAYLKNSKNLVFVRSEVLLNEDDDGNVERRQPRWFIADEFNDAPPVMPLPRREPDKLDYTAKKLTAEAAGETREPGAVVRSYRCRRGCEDMVYDSRRERDEHEDTVHGEEPPEEEIIEALPAEAEPEFPGELECPACGKESSTQGNLRAHINDLHPRQAITLLPWPCPVMRCHDRFFTQRGLKYHLGNRGGHRLTKETRDRLIQQVTDQVFKTGRVIRTEVADLPPNPEPAAVPAAPPVQKAQQPAVPVEPVVPVPAPVVASDAVAYVHQLMEAAEAGAQAAAERDQLKAENARLKAEIAEQRAMLDLIKPSIKDLAAFLRDE